jgi:hypothetical protein
VATASGGYTYAQGPTPQPTVATPISAYAVPATPQPCMMPSMPNVLPQGVFEENLPPSSFTRGFPDPSSIEDQKVAYSKSLEIQLEHGHQSLKLQNEERKKQLFQAAQQRKAALILQVEQQMKMQEMALDEQTNQAMMGLKKAALDQRAALEQQAASLTLEYQQRKMAEEFAATQAEMQRQYVESQAKLHSEVNKHCGEPRQVSSSVPFALPSHMTNNIGMPPATNYASGYGVMPGTYAPAQVQQVR